jgi:nucleotide-binding universal stress UspA family protein
VNSLSKGQTGIDHHPMFAWRTGRVNAMFEHVLVPLDGSSLAESILPHVLSIAGTCKAQVTLMHVLDQSPPLTPVDPGSWSFRKAEGRAYLHKISDGLYDLGWQCGTVLDEGHAAERIIQYARDNQISLIAMSSHGQSGLSGWNISSVVQKVLFRSSTSVLLVPAYRNFHFDLTELRYKRICVPLDCSQRAEYVLPMAAKLASSSHGSLLLAHIVPRPGMPSHLPLSPREIELGDLVVERNHRVASKYLEGLQYRLSSDKYHVQKCVQISENPIEALHELVEQEGADLLVLNAHGYSGGCRWPYGSVTLSFIAYGTTPLLILQDLDPERIRPTYAELATKEQPVH